MDKSGVTYGEVAALLAWLKKNKTRITLGIAAVWLTALAAVASAAADWYAVLK